jgi:hypothetical protein
MAVIATRELMRTGHLVVSAVMEDGSIPPDYAQQLDEDEQEQRAERYRDGKWAMVALTVTVFWHNIGVGQDADAEIEHGNVSDEVQADAWEFRTPQYDGANRIDHGSTLNALVRGALDSAGEWVARVGTPCVELSAALNAVRAWADPDDPYEEAKLRIMAPRLSLPLPEEHLRAAVERWSVAAGYWLGSEEAIRAENIARTLSDAFVRTAALDVAAKLWHKLGPLHPSLHLDHLDTLAVVVAAIQDGRLLPRNRPDAQYFLRRLIRLFDSEQEAAEHGLHSVRKSVAQASTLGQELPANVKDLDEVRRICRSGDRRIEWFEVPEVGWIVFTR